jgi:hypothetical protein
VRGMLFGAEKGGGGSGWGGATVLLVRSPAPVPRLVDRPWWGCRSSLRRAGRHGVLRQGGRTGSINKDDVATGQWGHDKHDPRRPRSGRLPAHAAVRLRRRMCPSRNP